MDALYNYINNPNSSIANFELAREYEKLGQTGSALSWYLRAAEKARVDIEQYEALLHCALCLERQKTRDDSEKVLLLKAISLIESRPEAYYLLARLFEHLKWWQDSYTFADLGLKHADFDTEPLEDLEYPGKYALYFQKGVAAWWIGHVDESREIMVDLKYNYKMNDVFTNAVNNNLNIIGYPFTISRYDETQADKLRYKFDNVELITDNFSQTYQDIFVLSMLNGKKNGYYLEVGCAEPFENNNTALLETVFDWKGVSLDINHKVVGDFMLQRDNAVFCLDATKIDYSKLLVKQNAPKDIDYLQIDCDPPSVSFAILQIIPFHEYRFAVITFEHDFYADPTIRDKSRAYLQSKGYQLVAADIAYNKTNSFEDWWVHPELVDADILKTMVDINTGAKYVRDYILKK